MKNSLRGLARTFLLAAIGASAQAASLGQFDGHDDIGSPKLAGAATYNAVLAGIRGQRRRRQHVGQPR